MEIIIIKLANLRIELPTFTRSKETIKCQKSIHYKRYKYSETQICARPRLCFASKDLHRFTTENKTMKRL